MTKVNKQKIVVLTAPSGAGKTTVARRLLSSIPQLAFSVSATTRAARDYEKHGIHYYFLSPEAFKTKIFNGDFLEYVEVYEHQFYGSLKSEVNRLNDLGKIALFDIDVDGARRLKKYFGNQSLVIFVAPPSKDVLKTRLLNRNTETPDSFERRLKRMEYELSFSDKFDVCIINDDLDGAVREATEIVKTFINPEENGQHKNSNDQWREN